MAKLTKIRVAVPLPKIQGRTGAYKRFISSLRLPHFIIRPYALRQRLSVGVIPARIRACGHSAFDIGRR